MAKEEVVMIRMNTELRERIKAEALKQEISIPEYMRQALENWTSFNVHFLEKIYILAEDQKIPMTLVIQQLLTSYLGQDYAFQDVFGMPTRAFTRAFQHDEKGLISGNKLSELVFQQTLADIAGLRNKLIQSVQEGKAAVITKEEAAILGAAPSETNT